MSSCGVLVVSRHGFSQHEIESRRAAGIKIEWRLLLDRSIPLQLFALGRVIRCAAIDFAAALKRQSVP